VEIKPQLRTIPGVSDVNAWGGETKQYQIKVDPALLQQYGLTLNDVATRVATVVIGGLISSTLLTLFLPTFYDWFDRSPKSRDAAHDRSLTALGSEKRHCVSR
jgi:Cu/Ag efflux pump CusA